MIKCLCKNGIQDKYTGEDYIAGKVYEFEDERAKEVLEAYNGNYFTEVAEEKTKKAKKANAKGTK